MSYLLGLSQKEKSWIIFAALGDAVIRNILSLCPAVKIFYGVLARLY